jgi:hypothetical protein
MPSDAPLTPEQEEAQAQADFYSAGDPGHEKKPAAKPEAAAKAEDTAKVPPPPKPEYVKITRKDWDEVRAAAARTASYDSQLSKAFGTIGGLQKALTDLRNEGPRTGKFEIPKDAFADMERDFPELAQQTRAAMEKALRGVTGSPGAASIDPDEMKRLVAEHATQVRIDAEIEALEEDHPDWRKIVGQVDTSKQQPDPNNAFRKWLATKDAAYQARLNSTNSAAVISRAISRFRSETKPAPPPAPTLQQQLRNARIKGAVQPRGDGGQPAQANTDEDEFAAGFNSRNAR